MKVKIEKGKKTKEYKLINSWEDVTLEKWLKLIDFNSLSKAEEAQQVISALSTIPKKLVNELSLKDVALMMALLKIARTKLGEHNKDDYVDLVGYGAIAGEIAELEDDNQLDLFKSYGGTEPD